MNKLVRGVVTGSLIGAAVGVAMLWRNRKGKKLMNRSQMNLKHMNQGTRGTIRMMKDNAVHISSAVKDGTRAFTRRLSKRTAH